MLKTILIHIDGSSTQDSRLRAAAHLAAEHGAHVTGNAATGITMAAYAVLGGSMAMPLTDRNFNELRAAARAQLTAFTEQATRLGIASAEWQIFEGQVRDGLLLGSRYADLVVVSQDGERRSGSPERGLAQYLALHGTRPVLVVPASYRAEPIPGTALIGWDGSMPAQRAIAAALPLLARTAGVRLAIVNPDQQSGLHGDEPGADMALYLARHGLKVDVAVEHTRAPESETLMDMARDCHAGLMVTGAYGHSRYREWMLGGVTRDMLDHAPVPLFIAH